MLAMLKGLRLPSSCAVCARWPAEPVCADCWHAHAQLRPRCPSCALPLAPGLTRCGRCSTAPPGPLDTCLARVDYTHPWADVVQRFKFHQEPAWAGTLAELMLEDAATVTSLHSVDCIAPIPLTTERLLERGYNQSWELVKQLRARTTCAPTVADLLHRTATGAALHTLPRAERFAHADKAFDVPAAHLPRVRQARVLLVDDVMTTGATLQAAALALRNAGAAAVSALVFARTPAPGSVE